MRFKERRERIRAVLSGSACMMPASVYDPISARIAEDLGFEVGMFAGSTASMTVLGAPDLLVLTLSEFAEQAGRICRAGELPLLVDADHGYGNALNVMRTVEELERAGVAALTIEDTELPLPFGRTSPPQLISIEEGVGKVRAALAARHDAGLVIAGRTSAPMLSGMDDAIARCRAYEKAGSDAIFIAGLTKRSELEALASAIRIPIILSRIEGELIDLDHLARNNVRIGLQGHQPIMAALQAVFDTMKALRDGVPPDRLERIAPDELVARVTRGANYRERVSKFLEV